MRRILCAVILLLVLSGCAEPMTEPEPTGSYKYGIYEFNFLEEQISGAPTDDWEFVYSYNGETIASGHQIAYSLELFTFYRIQVVATQKSNPDYTYSTIFPVAICEGGFGRTEITVIDTAGKNATFKIKCQVTQIGKVDFADKRLSSELYEKKLNRDTPKFENDGNINSLCLMH